MLRLLIVDDEPVITDSMFDILSDLKDLDLDIYRAYSGEEALNWINRTKIDIVLTDISMPGITGFDIQNHVLEVWPRCRIIFLSVHNEFDYVQSAIRKESYDYILKTEPEETVIAAVRKAGSEIENEIKKEYLLEKARKSMSLALPVLQSKCMLDILESIVVQPTEIKNLFQEFQIGLNAGLPVLLMVGKIDRWPDNLNTVKKMQIIYGIQDTVTNQLARMASVIPVISDRSTVVWFVQPMSDCITIQSQQYKVYWEKTILFIHGSMDNMQLYCNRLYGISLSLATGRKPTLWENVADKFETLKLSIEKASDMAQETLLIENDDLEENSFESLANEEFTMRSQLNRLNELKIYLERGEEEEFFKLFAVLMDSARKSKLYAFDISSEIYYLLSAMFISFLNRWKLVELVSYSVNLDKLKNMKEFKDWDEIVVYFTHLSKYLFKYRIDEGLRNANRIFGFIKNYVEQNISADLSLTRFAEMLNFHPFYLSRLFRNVTGKTLTEYISEQKIKKARELLQSSNLKINEIAGALGFDTASYFTRFFKKHTGITPQEYRIQLP